MSDATCRIEGCDNPRAENPKRTVCAMHHTRKTRHGSIDVDNTPVAERRLNSDGYVVTPTSRDHPLALATGRRTVLEHRLVLFAAIGDGPQECHYCGTTIWWEPTAGQVKLTVDHIDFDTENNDPSNLVPSCASCNSRRTRRAVNGLAYLTTG